MSNEEEENLTPTQLDRKIGKVKRDETLDEKYIKNEKLLCKSVIRHIAVERYGLLGQLVSNIVDGYLIHKNCITYEPHIHGHLYSDGTPIYTRKLDTTMFNKKYGDCANGSTLYKRKTVNKAVKWYWTLEEVEREKFRASAHMYDYNYNIKRCDDNENNIR